MKCPNCDGEAHPAWKAHTFKAAVLPAARKTTCPMPHPTKLRARKRKPAGSFDRNKYMREYMRKRRAR